MGRAGGSSAADVGGSMISLFIFLGPSFCPSSPFSSGYRHVISQGARAVGAADCALLMATLSATGACIAVTPSLFFGFVKDGTPENKCVCGSSISHPGRRDSNIMDPLNSSRTSSLFAQSGQLVPSFCLLGMHNLALQAGTACPLFSFD